MPALSFLSSTMERAKPAVARTSTGGKPTEMGVRYLSKNDAIDLSHLHHFASCSERRSTRSSARASSESRTRLPMSCWQARSSESASISGSPPRLSPHAACMIPSAGVPDIFDLILILVGPEAVNIIVGLQVAQKSACRRPSLLFCVVEVLDPDAPEERMQDVGHVPRGKDLRDAGLAVGVDENAIVQGNATA